MSADAPASPAPTQGDDFPCCGYHAAIADRDAGPASPPSEPGLAAEVRSLRRALGDERAARATAFRTLDEMRARFVPLAAATYTAARTWREMDPNTELGRGDRLAVQLAAPFGFVAEMDTLAALAHDGGRSAEILSGDEVAQLPDGSAVLIHTVDGNPVHRPHGAQIVVRGGWLISAGGDMPDRPGPDRTYRLLFRKAA